MDATILQNTNCSQKYHCGLFGFLLSIILSVVIGGASGVGATIWYLNVYQPQLLAKNTTTVATNDSQGKNQVLAVQEDSAAVDVAASVSPSVVSIVVSEELEQIVRQGPFSFQTEGSGTYEDVGGGTGFIVSDDGLIVTNKHVVSNAKAQYSAVLSDGSRHTLEVLSLDPLNDVAIVRISGGEKIDYKPITLGDSDALKIGQTVLAIGNTLAEYQNSVTKGVISGIGREIVAGGYSDQELLDDLLQTDAAINLGNSGGPLVNLSGQVVGINTAVDQQGENIGFAIPVNEIKVALDSYKEFGEIVRPMLGVRYTQITPELADSENLPVDHGAVIATGDSQNSAIVSGSPADTAGLRSGDILLSIDSVDIDETNTLSDLIQQHKVGDSIRVQYMRGDETISVDITLVKFQ